MTEFNTFDKFAEDEDVTLLSRKIVSYNNDLLKLKAVIHQSDAKKANLAKEMEAAKALINSLRDQQHQIEVDLFDVKKDMQEINSNIRKTETQLRQAQTNKEMADSFAALANDFEDVVAGLKWREWALDHQMTGAKHMAVARRALNADKMGLGKTLQSLMAADMLKAKRVLILTPNNITDNFVKEVKLWAPHRTLVQINNLPKATRDIYFQQFLPMTIKTQGEITVALNYEAWRKDPTFVKQLIDLKFDTVILDEAHYLKNRKTSAFKGVEAIVYAQNNCPVCNAQPEITMDDYGHRRLNCVNCHTLVPVDPNTGARPVDYWNSVKNVFPLTGTPILNRPQELYSILYLIARDEFPDENSFLEAYCQYDYYTKKWGFATGGLDSLAIKLAGRFIQRDRKTAGVIIPPQDIVNYAVELNEELYPRYAQFNRALTKHAALMLEDGKAYGIPAMIALITRKRQASVWPNGITVTDPETKAVILSIDDCDSPKMDTILARPDTAGSLLNEAGKGEWSGLLSDIVEGSSDRVVVFSMFKTALAELEKRCTDAGYTVCRYDGDTPNNRRSEIENDFDARTAPVNPRWQIVLANYKTGAEGLNLTGAQHIIEMDSEWNAGKVDQARGRIDRMGQTKETTVHRILMDRSIETWMDSLVESKRAMVDGFNEATNIAAAMLDAIRNGDII